jgi:hypothetical protein
MHTDSEKASPPSCLVRCTGCGRQMRVAVDCLLAREPVLCGWCEQDLLPAKQVRGDGADSGGSAPPDGLQG